MSVKRKDIRAHISVADHERLVAVCEADGVEMGAFIERIVITEVRRRCDDAVRLYKRLEILGHTCVIEPAAPKYDSERDYENRLVTELRERGLEVKTQVKTGVGTADIVIYSAEKPIAVVEVKLTITTWGKVRKTIHQVDAYAEALGVKHAWITAPQMDQSFPKKMGNVLEWASAAEIIHRKLGGVRLAEES